MAIESCNSEIPSGYHTAKGRVASLSETSIILTPEQALGYEIKTSTLKQHHITSITSMFDQHQWLNIPQ